VVVNPSQARFAAHQFFLFFYKIAIQRIGSSHKVQTIGSIVCSCSELSAGLQKCKPAIWIEGSFDLDDEPCIYE